MSVIAVAVRHLIAAGVTGDALVDAIADMEAEVRAEPKPRSAAAVRQERYRRNKASLVTVSDACDGAPLSLPPNEINSNPPTHTPPDNTPARARGPGKPDDVSPQTWADFVSLRKRKRADLSETAIAGIRREAAKAGWPLESALAEIVSRGWQGFKAEWVAGQSAAANSDNPLLSRLKSRQLATGP